VGNFLWLWLLLLFWRVRVSARGIIQYSHSSKETTKSLRVLIVRVSERAVYPRLGVKRGAGAGSIRLFMVIYFSFSSTNRYKSLNYKSDKRERFTWWRTQSHDSSYNI
jgi:hypothetical protein